MMSRAYNVMRRAYNVMRSGFLDSFLNYLIYYDLHDMVASGFLDCLVGHVADYLLRSSRNSHMLARRRTNNHFADHLLDILLDVFLDLFLDGVLDKTTNEFLDCNTLDRNVAAFMAYLLAYLLNDHSSDLFDFSFDFCLGLEIGHSLDLDHTPLRKAKTALIAHGMAIIVYQIIEFTSAIVMRTDIMTRLFNAGFHFKKIESTVDCKSFILSDSSNRPGNPFIF